MKSEFLVTQVCSYCRFFNLCKSKNKNLSFNHKLILSLITACSESYNISQSLLSSCHLGCDNQKLLDQKNKSIPKSDHRPLSSFRHPVSSSYQISWIKSFEERSSEKSPFLMLKHSWSRFFANRSFTFFKNEKSKEKEESTVTTKVNVTIIDNKKHSNGSNIERLTATKIPEIKAENKSVDCYIRGGVWPPLYIQESSIQLRGIEFCSKPTKFGRYAAIVSIVLIFFVILLFILQVNQYCSLMFDIFTGIFFISSSFVLLCIQPRQQLICMVSDMKKTLRKILAFYRLNQRKNWPIIKTSYHQVMKRQWKSFRRGLSIKEISWLRSWKRCQSGTIQIIFKYCVGIHCRIWPPSIRGNFDILKRGKLLIHSAEIIVQIKINFLMVTYIRFVRWEYFCHIGWPVKYIML